MGLRVCEATERERMREDASHRGKAKRLRDWGEDAEERGERQRREGQRERARAREREDGRRRWKEPKRSTEGRAVMSWGTMRRGMRQQGRTTQGLTSAATTEEARQSARGGAPAKHSLVFFRHRPVCTEYSVQKHIISPHVTSSVLMSHHQSSCHIISLHVTSSVLMSRQSTLSRSTVGT